MINEHCLLLLTQPNSGSTAMADFVSKSEAVCKLHDRYGGQWLVPGLCDNDRWYEDKFINYDSVRFCWHSKLSKINIKRKYKYVFEKSPPNLVRFKEIINMFEKTTVVVTNRNPFATIASQFHRYRKLDYGNCNHEDVVHFLTNKWIERSNLLKLACEENKFPLVTYEDFCDRPLLLVEKFKLPKY